MRALQQVDRFALAVFLLHQHEAAAQPVGET